MSATPDALQSVFNRAFAGLSQGREAFAPQLTLREVARGINRQRQEQEALRREGGFHTQVFERVMVGLSSNPEDGKRLLHKAARIAGQLNADWFAVHVETPAESVRKIDTANFVALLDNINLAGELGAETVWLKSADPVKAMLDEYRIRRDNLSGWLAADPRIKCLKPAGAFYMFPDISEAMAAGGFKTSIDFAQALLDEKRVAVTPGEAFDSPGFIRMSYATSMENLKEGSRRLVEFVQAHAGTPAAAAR